ncbi:MAG TPA: transcription termination/antitermination NusG family protein [Candidatus Acidoferrum sp.]|jgi:transcription antitermination factor NusG|nr:transcription termination/antitermination NusG family protein [Candidatus Acidoferrum sp.]
MDQSKSGNGFNWFALQVRSRWEGTTAGLLRGKGLETLLPTYATMRKWSDRFKVVESPLFPGYVFCRFDVHNRLPVLITPGVISVVGRGKTPIAVDDTEIFSIQAAIVSGIHIEPWPYVQIGERVRIKDDVLDGMEGILASFKGSHRVIISVSLLRRSVALEIDRSRITPLGSPRKAADGTTEELPVLEAVEV